MTTTTAQPAEMTEVVEEILEDTFELADPEWRDGAGFGWDLEIEEL
ncbi:MAG TPA: hypothetical protein VLR88_03245 [Propionibacteriaceae bacterium]|nr:hypothetical protein [Propionibacteriaceae bacterium]